MKGKNAKKPAANTVSNSTSSKSEGRSGVTLNQKHHKKPKKQYL